MLSVKSEISLITFNYAHFQTLYCLRSIQALTMIDVTCFECGKSSILVKIVSLPGLIIKKIKRQ